ncbi:MAG TPA: hypothetical protein VFH74_01650 [Gaiellales bacterium]|nr:hypothetical protein [Gaiellales bacterium]
MGWARYVLAIVIGLTVGLAVGWYSGRGHATPSAAGHRRHHRQVVDVRQGRHVPDHSQPSPAPQPPSRPPTIRELQQQLLECVFGHPTAEGQTACLQAVIQRELRLAGRGWPLPGGNGQALPFLSPSQD